MRMNHPEREYPRHQLPGWASGLFAVTRGDQGRDSKIEIVRAAALVLEPWVTATVESRRSQSAGPHISTLSALFFLSRK